MSNPMAKVHERGQEPVDEHHLVLRTSAHRTLLLPGRKPGVVALMPQRAYFDREFIDHGGRETLHPPVADDRSASRVPHHTTMIVEPEPTSHR